MQLAHLANLDLGNLIRGEDHLCHLELRWAAHGFGAATDRTDEVERKACSETPAPAHEFFDTARLFLCRLRARSKNTNCFCWQPWRCAREFFAPTFWNWKVLWRMPLPTGAFADRKQSVRRGSTIAPSTFLNIL